eukprot:g28464.t1
MSSPSARSEDLNLSLRHQLTATASATLYNSESATQSAVLRLGPVQPEIYRPVLAVPDAWLSPLDPTLPTASSPCMDGDLWIVKEVYANYFPTIASVCLDDDGLGLSESVLAYLPEVRFCVSTFSSASLPKLGKSSSLGSRNTGLKVFTAGLVSHSRKFVAESSELQLYQQLTKSLPLSMKAAVSTATHIGIKAAVQRQSVSSQFPKGPHRLC